MFVDPWVLGSFAYVFRKMNTIIRNITIIFLILAYLTGTAGMSVRIHICDVHPHAKLILPEKSLDCCENPHHDKQEQDDKNMVEHLHSCRTIIQNIQLENHTAEKSTFLHPLPGSLHAAVFPDPVKKFREPSGKTGFYVHFQSITGKDIVILYHKQKIPAP